MLKPSWNTGAVFCAIVVAVGLWSMPAEAQRGTADVPVQVGVGPTGNMMGGPTFDDEIGWGGGLFSDQPLHTGLRISATAVIDDELVRDHPRLVPRQYRGRVQQAGEVRYSPAVLALIPSSLYLSPPIADSSAWGATWSLLGLGLPFITEPFRASLSGSVIATLMYVDSESVSAPYFFARPGVELNLDIEFPLDDNFLISLGWASKVYLPPQPLDGTAIDIGSYGQDTLWHIGQFYIQAHFRFPYSYQYAGR